MSGTAFGPALFPSACEGAYNVTDGQDIREVMDSIQRHNVEWVNIRTADNLRFLHHCPSVRHISVSQAIDLSPLYELGDQLISLSITNLKPNRLRQRLRIGRFSKLQALYFPGMIVEGLGSCTTLRTLSMVGYPLEGGNLTELSGLVQLDTLNINQSGLCSLEGIGALCGLTCLYMGAEPRLMSIDSLADVASTLKVLELHSLRRVRDFSVLAGLKQVELLRLIGPNRLPSLAFVRSLPRLHAMLFDFDIRDCDLSPLLDIAYAKSIINRRKYYIKDCSLPKRAYGLGISAIAPWRRVRDDFEI